MIPVHCIYFVMFKIPICNSWFTYGTVKFHVMVKFVNIQSLTHDLLISNWGFDMILFSSKLKAVFDNHVHL